METIPGGCYKDAEGDGYHDANGNPVSKANVEKFLALQQQQTFGLGALDPAPVDEVALLKQQLADLQALQQKQAEQPDEIALLKQQLADLQAQVQAKPESKPEVSSNIDAGDLAAKAEASAKAAKK
mgnify:CR=1 FL=1